MRAAKSTPWVITMSLLVLLALGGCAAFSDPVATAEPATAAPSETATEASPVASATATLVLRARPTLPPTFTPTFTPSPTQTPSITPSPTITPTLNPEQLCNRFDFLYNDPDGTRYLPGDLITLFALADAPEVTIVYAAVHDESGEALRFELPGGKNLYSIPLRPERFPLPGAYTWTVSLTRGAETRLCERSGRFIIVQQIEPTASAEATAETTSEP